MKHPTNRKKHPKVLFHLTILAAAGYGIYKMWGDLKEKTGFQCPVREWIKKLRPQADKA